MESQGVAPPSTKKRNFLLRDLFKLCRSISRVLPIDKTHLHHKPKHHTKSKRNHEFKPQDLNNPTAFHFQDSKVKKVEGISLCKVHSYRYDGPDFLLSKKASLSRTCSQSTATMKTPTMRSLSLSGRIKNNNKTDGFTPTLMRSTSVQKSFKNPILYSSSSTKVAKPPPTEKELSCTLEELCSGCTKKIKIKRDVISSSGKLSEEEETVEIKVKPGWKGGTKVTFEGKGNEAMGSLPADLTFIISEKDHQVFKREGDDLEMEVEISLLEALTGCDLSIALLDGNNMCLKIEDVIFPGYVKLVQGKGMPNLKEKGKRGDLKVKFQIKFPKKLTDHQKAEIQSILQD